MMGYIQTRVHTTRIRNNMLRPHRNGVHHRTASALHLPHHITISQYYAITHHITISHHHTLSAPAGQPHLQANLCLRPAPQCRGDLRP